MSKSDHPDSYVALGEPANSVLNKFKRAVTDSDTQVRYNKIEKPAISNLMEIYAGFSGMSLEEIESKYKGIGYGEFKNDLGELTAEKLSLLQKDFEKYRSNEGSLMSIIEEGSQKASAIASKKLSEVKNKIGLL
jgi:tryptophanyl-tRNA synthetase